MMISREGLQEDQAQSVRVPSLQLHLGKQCKQTFETPTTPFQLAIRITSYFTTKFIIRPGT
ncbi:MAG: hypothetical protein C0478_03920 [Planctomyces sp.]|nr:hypothetical protein [Planctomyces sp.]